jgi:hypothetical protein
MLFVQLAVASFVYQTKAVIQKTRGHASPPISEIFSKFPFGVVCPFFSTGKSTHQSDEPNLTLNFFDRANVYYRQENALLIDYEYFY